MPFVLLGILVALAAVSVVLAVYLLIKKWL